VDRHPQSTLAHERARGGCDRDPGVGAVVANATLNACGKRVRALPITLDQSMD
jgi:hypothetical protein